VKRKATFLFQKISNGLKNAPEEEDVAVLNIPTTTRMNPEFPIHALVDTQHKEESSRASSIRSRSTAHGDHHWICQLYHYLYITTTTLTWISVELKCFQETSKLSNSRLLANLW
jgi:hypothetical protein